MLYSADFMGVLISPHVSDPLGLADWGTDTNTAFNGTTLPALPSLHSLPALPTPPGTDTDTQDEQLVAETDAAIESRRVELVLIDSNVADTQQLIDDLREDSDREVLVHVLNENANGIEQITDILALYSGLDAVHLISHGSDTGLQLGNSWLDSDNLDNYQQAISGWRDALDAEADLLIYGCNLAGSMQGQDLLTDLSELTGADVAASTDITGQAELGGDWDLEFQSGNVESAVVFSNQLQQNWLGTLPISTRETEDTDGDGQIDRIKITATGNLNDDFSDLTITVAGYALDATTPYSTDVAGDKVFYVNLVESGIADTGATPLVTVTANTLLKAGAKIATDAGVVATDTASPFIIARDTADLNGDGFIDAIHLTFSEAISDATVTANDFDVLGVIGEAFLSTTNGDTVDDNDIYITFTDGLLNTSAKPDITYTADGVTDPNVQDLAGNLLPDTGSWWDINWQNRTKITFSGNDAAGTQNLDNFTVLVSLTAAEVDFAKIQAGGADIRFVDADGVTPLSYQIETWDDAAQTATVWVKVPRIDMGSIVDNIYIYYNNAAAVDASSTAAWDANYQGVWHLNEATGVTAVDSTINTNDATAVNNPTASTGKVGGGLTFFSASELNIATDPSLDLSTYSDWTISAWVKPTDYTGVKWPVVYSYGIYDASLGLTVWEGTAGLIENWINDATLSLSTTATTFNAWNHIAITRDATTTTFYLNGVAVGTSASATINTAGLTSFIGNNGFATDQFIGLIDEVRVSAGAITDASRSAEWMAAQYNSMNLAFNSYGAEESFVVDAVNTAPTLTATAVNPVFTEGGVVADLFSGIALSTIEVGQTIDQLIFTMTSITDGVDEIVVIDGENVALTNANVGTTLANGYGYSVSLAGTTATVILTTTGTSVANAQILVDGLAYTNTSDNPTTTNRIATLTSVKDSGGVLNGGIDTTAVSIGSTVTVNAVNDAPIASNDAYNVNEDSILNVAAPGPLGNDNDWEFDPLSVLDYSKPANGSLIMNADGSFSYTPNANYFGADSFKYVVTDGNDGTVHYWKLDGNGIDSVGASNGTVTGTTTVAGYYGDALSFDEIDDQIIVPDFAYTNEFSLSFRFKVDDISGNFYQYIYSHGALDTPNSVNIHLGEIGSEMPGLLRTTLRDSNDIADETALDVDINSLIGDGQWHTYTWTVEPGVGSKVYIDGVLANSSTGGGDSFNPATNLYLGTRSDLPTDRYYGGQLDGVQIFNRALSPTDVIDLNTGGSSLGTVDIVVNAVNDAPTLAATAVNPVFTDGGPAADLFSGITINTIESGQTIEELKFTLTNVIDGVDEILVIDGESVVLTNANAGSTLANGYGYSVSLAGTTATVTLTTTGASVANAQILVDGLAYINSSINSTTASRIATLTSIKDSGGTASGGVDTTALSINSTVTVANDAPILTATGDNPFFTLGGNNAGLFSSISITAVESGQTIEELQFTVTNVTDGANEIIAIDGEDIALTNANSGSTLAGGYGYSVSLTGNTATVTLTTTGTSAADAQILLGSLAYGNTSSTPTLSDRVVTLTSIKDNGGTASGGLDTSVPAITSTVNVNPAIQTPSLRLHYGQGTDPVLQMRDWDYNTSTWSAETASVSTSSTIKWTINQLNADRFEELVVVLSDSGLGTELDVSRWDGIAWTVDWTATGIASANSDTRGFDIAYEQSSGDAMVVYSNNTANPVFRTWDGSSWSSEQSIFASAPGTGTVLWVEMDSRPGTDEIALVYSDSNSDLHAVIWDGTSWTESTTEITLEVSLQAINYRDFDVAYENSGDLMVAWGRGTNVDYATKAAGTTTWVNGTSFLLVNGNVAIVDLAAEPGGDRIALLGFDVDLGTERLGLSTWNGTSWQNTGEYDNTFPHAETDGFGEFWGSVGWVGTSGEAVVVYSDSDAGVVNWGNWTSGAGWTIQTDVTATGAGHLRSVQMESYPDRNELMTVFSDSNGALWAASYDGATWSITNAGVALESNLSHHKTVAFSFDLGGNVNPVANIDVYSVNEDTTLNVAAPGLLANDNDGDSDPLTVLDYSKPSNGTVTVNADGSFSYTPNADFNGTDSFSYIATDSNNGTVHYWKLDGDGTDSVGGSNGVVTGTTAVAGHYGDAMNFDGIDDQIIVPDFAYANEFSVSIRFKVDDILGSSYQYLYSHGAVTTLNSVGIYIGEIGSLDPGILRTNLRDSNDISDKTALDVDINSLIGDGQWHTYTWTVESGVGSKVFIDGVLANSSTGGGDSFNPTTSLHLGTRVDLPATRFYGGQLDSVQIFNRTLSPTDVDDLNTGGSSLGVVNLVVNPVNDALTLTATGVNPMFTEGGASADLFSGITINTIEAGETIEELQFTVTNVTDGSSEIAVIDGENITLTNANSGTTVASSYGYSVSLSGTTATVTLTTTGTSVANAQLLIDGLAYINSSSDPTNLSRVATLTSIKDSGGTAFAGVDTTAISIGSTVTVNTVNDASILTATGTSPTFNEDGASADLFSGITINTIEAGQTVEELQFTVTNVSDGIDEILVIDGENITLTNANSGTTLANGYGYSISLAGTTATVILTTTGTSVANAQILVDGLAYQNTNNEPTTLNRVATLTSIKDSGGVLNGGVDTTVLSTASTVSVNAANDAPTLTATAVNPVFLGSGANVDLFAGVAINTVEAGQSIEEMQFTVSNITDGANEIIVIDGENIALSDLNTGTTIINGYGYSVSLAGSTATVTLTTTGTSIANAQTLVDGLAYQNTSGTPTIADRVATLTSIKDSGGTANGGIDTTVVSIASTVTVMAANNGATLTATAVDPTFTEGGASADLFAGVTINTVAAGQTVEELQFTLTSITDGTSEIIVIDGENITLDDLNTGTTITNGYGYSISLAGSTATVTLTTTGTSVASAQTLVDGLAYENTNSNPTVTDRIATLSSIKDSSGIAATALSIASTIATNTVNDTPALMATELNQTSIGGGAQVDLFTGVTINTVEPGQTVEELQFTVTNILASNEVVVIDGESIALIDLNTGTTIANGYDYNIIFSDSTATVTLTTTGTSIVDAQMLVDGLAYQKTTGTFAFGDRIATLTSIKDSGGTAYGGIDTSLLSTATKITVITVNDSPTQAVTPVESDATSADLITEKIIQPVESVETIVEEEVIVVEEVEQLASEDVTEVDEADEAEKLNIFEVSDASAQSTETGSSDNLRQNVYAGFGVIQDTIGSEFRNEDTPIKEKFLDLQRLEIRQFETISPQSIKLEEIALRKSIFESLDELGDNLEDSTDDEEEDRVEEKVIFSAAAMAITAQFMTWMLRAGSLFASFLSVIPLWRQFDPLPILAVGTRKRKDVEVDNDEIEADDSVESLFDHPETKVN